MGYSIELIDRKTEKVVHLENKEFLRSGLVPVIYDETSGHLIPQGSQEASLSVTYNYSKYYYEATEGDDRFANPNDGKIEYGIRGLYGKTAWESIPMLKDMIQRIELKYRPNGEWLQTTRKKKVYLDPATGKQYHPVEALGIAASLQKIEKSYAVSEGDTSNYWEETAANAILPLRDMLRLAKQFADEDAVWSGD